MATKASVIEIPESFVKAFTQCIDYVGHRLEPPYGGMPIREIVTILKKIVRADAVSIFSVSNDDPNKLVCSAGVGYRKQHEEKTYFVQQKAFTSWVFRTGKPMNMSRQQLEEFAQKGEIEYTGSCILNIETGRFTNIIASPIQFGGIRLGVLKIENQEGKTGADCFDPPDFALAKMLAPLIAVAEQQQMCRERWEECERARREWRSPRTYLQEMTVILKGWLNAECASVFLREQSADGKEALRYAAGVGYRKAYESSVYDINELALTTFVYKSRQWLFKTERELTEPKGGIDYRGLCSSYIDSGSFRGILAGPLGSGSDREPLGVLKVENKLPADAEFDQQDQDVCKAVVDRQIVPTLLSLQSKGEDGESPATEGYRLLVKEFHEPRRLKKEALLARVTDVVGFMREHPKRVRPDDCAQYLQISRPHFYRLKRMVSGPSEVGKEGRPAARAPGR